MTAHLPGSMKRSHHPTRKDAQRFAKDRDRQLARLIRENEEAEREKGRGILDGALPDYEELPLNHRRSEP